MGKKDIVDRPYFSDCERFAELMNVSLYHGERVLRTENLALQRRKYLSLANSYGETERDVLMKDVSQNIFYGIEIETESDYSMPERVMAYNTCEYEYQIKELDREHREKRDYRSYRERKSRMKESDFLLPMVTVVLYLKEGHWEGRRKLSHMFQTEAFQCLSPETERIIARHLRIERLIHKMEKEELPMCKAFDDLMREERREGRKEGRREGKKEGRREEKIRIIKQMIKEDLDESFIRRLTKCTKEELAAAGRPVSC